MLAHLAEAFPGEAQPASLRGNAGVDHQQVMARDLLEAAVHHDRVLDREAAHELGLELLVHEEGHGTQPKLKCAEGSIAAQA